MRDNNGSRGILIAALIASAGLLIAGYQPPAERRDLAHAGRRPRPGQRQQDAGQDPKTSRGRGHHADAPSEIPARGWWDILRRTAQQASEDRILTEAAGITFFALLALFPALSALVSLYGLFADPAQIREHLAALGGVIPGGGMEIIEEQVQRVASQGQASLGFGLAAGLAVSLWSANAATKAAFDTLNIVYEEKEQRSFLKRTAITLAFTVGAIIFALLAMGAVVVLPIALGFLGLGETMETLLHWLRWPLLLVAVAILFACLFRYGPSRDHAKWRWVSWGGAFAAVAWLLGSAAFSFYVANFGSYNETYGSLGAVIGFMTWIWISSAVVLTGAELDAEMERQTSHDTTEGPHEPMGTRGAAMADTVASGKE
ncbi:YihY/virulence factor BrkB family protein [Roseomonas sp. SSH11]|uniref:YihY/virulence factor BrkB family protein n=1 Tax=Pararoseomonas baculiformis TaxID=2820812 RepID=A0ABS4AJ82_9PROT|nr:YihY/virulence factor BrkB family protein [Pararoseomonas baculiformis]MBP0446936.1 YihY/virulence factor BrkB family protein [Pararoseomonas baculiformis]